MRLALFQLFLYLFHFSFLFDGNKVLVIATIFCSDFRRLFLSSFTFVIVGIVYPLV